MGRLLAIWLDGYESTLADAMTSELPSLARLREKSARFLLEDGLAQLTGLTAEHVILVWDQIILGAGLTCFLIKRATGFGRKVPFCAFSLNNAG